MLENELSVGEGLREVESLCNFTEVQEDLEGISKTQSFESEVFFKDEPNPKLLKECYGLSTSID